MRILAFMIGVGLMTLVGMAAPHSTVTISCVGDILPATSSDQSDTSPFSGVAEILHEDDLTVGNLECALSTRGSAADKAYTFRVDPAHVSRLVEGGIDIVSLANNHSLDYGRDALRDTIAVLRRAGIGVAGAGEDVDAAHAPYIRVVNGQRVAIVAASRVLPDTSWYATATRPGVAGAYASTRLLAAIRRARETADIVLVYLHWGKERAVSPEPYQRTLARQCIDAGTDVVVGAHPHVWQGFEYYQGKLIAYSLGNFVFAFRDTSTAVLQLRFTEDACTSARVIPCRVRARRPAPMTDTAACSAMWRALQARSFGVRITDQGEVQPVVR